MSWRSHLTRPWPAAARRGAARRFTRRQGWWFFLLLPFEGLNLHVQSIRTVLGRAPVRLRAVEASFLTVRLAGYVALLFVLLPPGKAAAFVAVQLSLFGVLLGGAFAPNHIGMPIVPADARPDFLRRQVMMSRNVSGGRLTGFFMGGLNHQIEHHLFPNMPRPGLRHARPLVRSYCAEHRIAYTETTLPQAYSTIVRYLNTVGLRNRDPFRCPLVTFAPDERVAVRVNTEPETTLDLFNAVAITDEQATGSTLPALTLFDSCDALDCSSQAYVRARFQNGLELVFCSHHGHDLMPSLVGRGAVVRDDSHRLTADRRLDTGS